MTSCKAAVLTGPRAIHTETFDLPETGRDDGLLAVEACGLCGSDVNPYLRGGGPAGWPRRIETPVILGHEVVGRLSDLGPEAQRRWGVSEGDRVLVERWLPCGNCVHCRSGAFQHCVRRIGDHDLFYGGTPTTVEPALWGGLTEYLYLHPDTVMHKVSDEAPADVFPLFLPLANAVSWMTETGGLRLGGSVLIQGPGPIGLCCALVAASTGAAQVVISGLRPDADRLALAAELTGAVTVDAGADSVANACREVTGGAGVDLVIDATRSESLAPVATAVEAVRTGGRVVLASEHRSTEGSASIVDSVVSKTLNVVGVRSRTRHAVATALELLVQDWWTSRLLRLVDPVVSVDEVAQGFEAVVAGRALHASMSNVESRRAA